MTYLLHCCLKHSLIEYYIFFGIQTFTTKLIILQDIYIVIQCNITMLSYINAIDIKHIKKTIRNHKLN